MQTTPSQLAAVEWEGGSLDELVNMLAAPALAVRVEVRTPSAGKPKKVGEIHMVAGGIYETIAGELRGDEALAMLRATSPLSYRIQARLPNPDDGGLLVPGPSEGTLSDRSVAALMRYCELYVLSGTIEIWRDTDRAIVEYLKGEIKKIVVNDDADEERLPEVLGWDSGGYRIIQAALNLPAASRTPQPVTTTVPKAAAVAPSVAPVAAAQAPAAAPVAATPAATPAPASAAPPQARTIFGMAPPNIQQMAKDMQAAKDAAAAKEAAASQASKEASNATIRRVPDESQDPNRSTSAGMRLDVYDKADPIRTTNPGVPVVATPSKSYDAAPAEKQPDLTTLPEREPAAKSTPAKSAPRETEKVATLNKLEKPQGKKNKKKGGGGSAAKSDKSERRPSTEEKRPLVAAPSKELTTPPKGQMSMASYITIGLALGGAIAVIYWLIQLASN